MVGIAHTPVSVEEQYCNGKILKNLGRQSADTSFAVTPKCDL